MHKIQALLKMTKKDSGASVEEAHTAAMIAAKMAKKYNVEPDIVAKCLNAVHQTNARRASVRRA